MLRSLIARAVRKCSYTHAGPRVRRKIISFDGKLLFWRYEFAWPDEWVTKNGTHINRPPWYRPFNVLLHCWCPQSSEEFHDHPRWSITVCLQGQLTEHTPWGKRTLTPGCVVFRSRKAIHAFSVEPQWKGKTWTLFVVGRRNHPQNTYVFKRAT